MILTVFTLALILVGVIAYFYGALKLAKYGFRLSTAVGLAVILFPPFTFYFALKKLEVDGKETPTAMVFFGLVTTILLSVIFWYPLSLFLTGNFDELDRYMTVNPAPPGVVVASDEDAAALASADPAEAAAAQERLEAAQREAQGIPATAESADEAGAGENGAGQEESEASEDSGGQE